MNMLNIGGTMVDMKARRFCPTCHRLCGSVTISTDPVTKKPIIKVQCPYCGCQKTKRNEAKAKKRAEQAAKNAAATAAEPTV